VVEASSIKNQLDRVSVILDADFLTPLIGGLPTCSDLCRRARRCVRRWRARPGARRVQKRGIRADYWHEHQLMPHFLALFGISQEQAYRSIRSNRQQGILSPGLARSDRTSPSSFIRPSSAWPARRRSLGADHPTGIDRHNEYDAITTSDCSVV
jgi:hypothetical protein